MKNLHTRTKTTQSGEIIKVFPDAVVGKSYPDAQFTHPVYFYGPSSDAAQTVLAHSKFIEKVRTILKKELPFEKLENLYSNGLPICQGPEEVCESWKKISYNLDKNYWMNLGALGTVGLGKIGQFHLSDLILYVHKKADSFYIFTASLTTRIEDYGDFNYFKIDKKWWNTLLYKFAGSSVSAATIQCGFMKDGRANDGAGQVGRVQIDTQIENGWIRFIEPIKITKKTTK